MIELLEHMPKAVKYTADASVGGIVVIGWLSLIQPWLTAIATLLAICWTGVQLYGWFKKK